MFSVCVLCAVPFSFLSCGVDTQQDNKNSLVVKAQKNKVNHKKEQILLEFNEQKYFLDNEEVKDISIIDLSKYVNNNFSYLKKKLVYKTDFENIDNILNYFKVPYLGEVSEIIRSLRIENILKFKSKKEEILKLVNFLKDWLNDENKGILNLVDTPKHFNQYKLFLKENFNNYFFNENEKDFKYSDDDEQKQEIQKFNLITDSFVKENFLQLNSENKYDEFWWTFRNIYLSLIVTLKQAKLYSEYLNFLTVFLQLENFDNWEKNKLIVSELQVINQLNNDFLHINNLLGFINQEQQQNKLYLFPNEAINEVSQNNKSDFESTYNWCINLNLEIKTLFYEKKIDFEQNRKNDYDDFINAYIQKKDWKITNWEYNELIAQIDSFFAD
ncbi:hypothetical protein [[Mycoplasma] gypis]|uniref:Lipoprotein n=1 Tax=[Mycoplasma] gypis TaxID=92404 RepID=A0ABZ2RNK0_9BACT|nr:hypothetical protein [[Mycoplasma] gypis]MBN0919390.1 hypothetical protein [[Mycoplasma] gypis]